jgi:hypothetical protein
MKAKSAIISCLSSLRWLNARVWKLLILSEIARRETMNRLWYLLLLLISFFCLLIYIWLIASLGMKHLLVIDKHIDQELSIIKVLRLLVCQVSHDPYFLQKILSKLYDIISLNLEIIEWRNRQELKSVVLMLTLIFLNVSQGIVKVTLQNSRVTSILSLLLALQKLALFTH